MKAIILAAGRGSRLLSLTDDRPKCMVELKGRPLLSWQIKSLREAGIKEILVVCGYLKEKINGDFETVENTRWQETNMVTSLLCAREWMESGDCIVSYSDIVYPSAAVKKLIAAPATMSILYDVNWLQLWQQRFDDPLSDAESFSLQDGTIQEIGQKRPLSLDQIQGQYMGLLRFSPKSTKWVTGLLNNDVELSDKLDMTALLSMLIAQGKPITAIPWNGAWCEIDNQRDLKIAHKIFI